MDTIGVNSGEKKTIELCLNQHSDSETFVTKIHVLTESKKNKYSEGRILIVGRHRVYIFKSGKPSHEIFFLDISEISSPSTTTLSIKSKSGLLQMEGEAEQIDQVISKIYASYAATFPAVRDQLPILTIPEDRAPKLKSVVESKLKLDENCGLFTNTYKAICDHLDVTPLEDLIWHVNHLFVANEVTDFRLYECALRPERLKSDDARALLTTLMYNTYFTGLFVDKVKLDSHCTTAITNILENNKVLRKFTLKEPSLKSDVFLAFTSAFERNPSLKLSYIDWSDNNVGDKTILTFAANMPAFISGLSHLNLANCGISSRSISVLIKGLESHEKTCENLTYLNLSGNKIDAEGCKALGALFAKTSKLTELRLASTSVDYRLLQKLESLQILDISGTKIVTKDARHTDLLRFLQLAPNLTKLNVSDTNFPPEIFAPFFEAVPHLEALNLADNSIGDAGLTALAEILPTVPNSLNVLILDRNFEKSTKGRTKAVQAFSDYLAGENCKLTTLSMQGSPKGGMLKGDLMPIAFGLLSNRSLQKVDLSGNLAGSGLALAVNKFLQINDVLEELYIDDNVFTVFSLQLIRAGLARNTSVRALPLPIDTSFLLKEHAKVTLEILSDIQTMLNANASRPASSRERAFSLVYSSSNDNKGPTSSVSSPPIPDSKGSGLTVASRERSKSNADKPLPTPPAPKQTASNAQPATVSGGTSFFGRKKKQKKEKPSVMDAKHASALFSSLSENASAPEETPEGLQKLATKEPEKKKEETKKENDNAKQDPPKK